MFNLAQISPVNADSMNVLNVFNINFDDDKSSDSSGDEDDENELIRKKNKKPKYNAKLLMCIIISIGLSFFASMVTFILVPERHYYSVTSSKSDQQLLSTHFVLKSPEVPSNYQERNRFWSELNSTLAFHSCSHLEFKVTDLFKDTWEMPDGFPYPHLKEKLNPPCAADKTELIFKYKTQPFSVQVKRRSTDEILFDMEDYAFIFTQKYVEISTSIPTMNIYGLGERLYKFTLDPGTYTTMPQDEPLIIEDGTPGHNTYGEHTVLLIREKSGKFFVLFLRNSNPKETIIDKNNKLRFRIVGGVIDFHIFLGNTPEDAIKQYHEYIGGWSIPPFWSLGYHQCKWGYKNLQTLKEVIEGFNSFDIPLDVIWSDIDYMMGYTPFVLDKTNFPPEEMRQMLKQSGKRWVPIVDAGIGSKPSALNVALTKAREMDVILKNKDGRPFDGKVWPGDSYFIDFFHPNAENYWVEMLEYLYDQIPFNGVWLDMNEIANFCNGDCRTGQSEEYNRLAWSPGSNGHSLEYKAIRMDALHYGNIPELYVHSLFNLFQQKATYRFLKSKHTLPFILTRANVFGSGQFSAHWFGDTRADWASMRYTVGSLLNYNIFGMPLIGGDLCGFAPDTTAELCARWTQLGVFYTFTRNHHEIGDGSGNNRQEPWKFNDDKILQTIKLAIKLKYSILKHLYTLFIYQGGKGSVIRPMFFEFPHDSNFFDPTKKYVDEQFMIGGALMVTPALYESMTEVNAYFPAGTWYHFTGGQKVLFEGNERLHKGKSPLGAEPLLYIRGGYIVQREDLTEVKSTKDLPNSYELVIAHDERKEGLKESRAGGILMDLKDFDEDSTHNKCILNNCIVHVDSIYDQPVENGKFRLLLGFKRDTHAEAKFKIKQVTIYGSGISKAELEGKIHTVDVMSGNVKMGSVEISTSVDDQLSIVFKPELIVKSEKYLITL